MTLVSVGAEASHPFMHEVVGGASPCATTAHTQSEAGIRSKPRIPRPEPHESRPPKPESPDREFTQPLPSEPQPATQPPAPNAWPEHYAFESHALPAGYIGKPHGSLQRDPRNRGIFFDDRGQRYLQSNGSPYAARYDRANKTWRAVQLDDPAKPGVPVKQNADGNWSLHSEVGALGGDPVNPAAQIAARW
jgi:hypothetical protein